MVKQVLAWSEAQAKEADPGAKVFEDENFSALKENYEKLQATLTRNTGSVQSFVQETRDLCTEIREILQDISEQSEVPIEPEKQTKLIDDLFECIPADRLLYASVPGAGGDDAIFALGL